jgi:lactate dehydrogenase-like 2-hydroxyacid dehydrogenase
MKVFITNIIPEAGLKLLRDAGIEIEEWKERRNLTPEELIEKSKKSDAIIIAGYSVIDAHFLNACKHLKVISLHSVGFDRVDIAEATKLKIPVGNTPGVVSAATADTAFLLMLAVSRKAFYQYRRIVNGDWNFFEPTANLGIEPYGKTLGIYGLGHIGFEMAKRCVGAYNMKMLYHNRNHNEHAERALNAKMVSFEELLKTSDIISVHTILSDETTNKFDRSAFNLIKSSSIFINTARGAIHNEKDLIEALQNGTIWGAGLDVTNPEPMAPDNLLLTMPNVAVLPHIGTATIKTRDAMATIAAQNVIAALNGQRIPYPVDPEVYYKMNLGK